MKKRFLTALCCLTLLLSLLPTAAFASARCALAVSVGKGGSVTPGTQSVAVGTEVVLTLTPEEGWLPDRVAVNGETVSPVRLYNGTWRLTLRVERETSVSVSFRLWSSPYSDVGEGSWYYRGVRFVSVFGLMDGADGRFDGAANATRAEVLTALWRLAAEPTPAAEEAKRCGAAFSDLTKDSLAYEAAVWACGAGVVQGYGDGRLGIASAVTRRQLAALLFRYAEALGLDTSARSTLSGFSDAGAAAGYAGDALAWAVGAGLFAGTSDGRLAPDGAVSRRQLAVVIARLCGAAA